MTDVRATADGAADPQPTTVFVVALKPPADATGKRPENIVPCAYFDGDWQPVAPNKIDTDKDSNSITFQQQSHLAADVAAQLQERGEEPDLDVSLFAAVAKTLQGTAELPRTFQAIGHDGATSITIPVDQHTRRGVVLVFRRPVAGAAERLIATADPEIRNGSGT
ncbi:MAG: hypothetical protein EOP35_01600 [Rubrivivax sp.]|nr:MAG: hypothetical protein EOP35_01600 [Rubrivivax sp.]